MSKVSILLKCLLLLFAASILLIKPPVVHAEPCSLTVDPARVKPDFNSDVILTIAPTQAGASCLLPNTNYVVIAYLNNLSDISDPTKCITTPEPMQCPWIWRKVTTGQGNTNTITTQLDFTAIKFFAHNDQTWKIVVCKGENLFSADCKDPNAHAATGGTIYLTNSPAGPPPDLPTISLDKQTACVFQAGNSNNSIIINQINQVDPSKTYGWWRYPVDSNIRTFQAGEFQVNQSTRQATATIPNTDIFKIGIQRICVDQTDQGTKRSDKVNFVNCLWVRFIASPVEDKDQISCQALQTAGSKGCIEPTDANKDDPNRCSSAGGLEIPGCGDKTDSRGAGIATAIGCIHTNPAEFIKDLLKFIVGISGGLAFLMMLLGAFQMLTSAGNPETLQAGRDRLTSAVIGLLFVIFAILLLQIIGVDILKIPGFGRQS